MQVSNDAGMMRINVQEKNWTGDVQCLQLNQENTPGERRRILKKLYPSSERSQNDEERKLREFRGVTDFYGNNTVYVTNGRRGVEKLDGYNFQVEAVEDTGSDKHVTSGVVVALGSFCELPEAIKQLEIVLHQMKADGAASTASHSNANVSKKTPP